MICNSDSIEQDRLPFDAGHFNRRNYTCVTSLYKVRARFVSFSHLNQNLTVNLVYIFKRYTWYRGLRNIQSRVWDVETDTAILTVTKRHSNRLTPLIIRNTHIQTHQELKKQEKNRDSKRHTLTHPHTHTITQSPHIINVLIELLDNTTRE